MKYSIEATEGSSGLIPNENLDYSIRRDRIVIYKNGEKVLDKEFIKDPNKTYSISTDNDTVDIIPDDVEECNVGTMLPQGMGIAHTKNINAAGVAKEVDMALVPSALYPSSPDIMNLEKASLKAELNKMIENLKYEKANGLISKDEIEKRYNAIKESVSDLLNHDSKTENITESSNIDSNSIETPNDTEIKDYNKKMFTYIESILDNDKYDEEVSVIYGCPEGLLNTIRTSIKLEKMLDKLLLDKNETINESSSSKSYDIISIKKDIINNEMEKRHFMRESTLETRNFAQAFEDSLMIKEADIDNDEKESELERLKEEYYTFARDNDTNENRKHKEYLRQRIKQLENKLNKEE